MQKSILIAGKYIFHRKLSEFWISLWRKVERNTLSTIEFESAEADMGYKNEKSRDMQSCSALAEREQSERMQSERIQTESPLVKVTRTQQERNSENELDMEILIEKYGNEILRMCYLYLHDLQLAEDAVQETYLRVYRNWNGYRGESHEKTWMIRIAINTCISMRRKRWFREAVSSGEQEQEIAVYDKYKDDTVVTSIYKLKPGLREVIIMFYYQQMKTREIAECLSISESAVCVRLNRARKQLGELLEGWYFDE